MFVTNTYATAWRPIPYEFNASGTEIRSIECMKLRLNLKAEFWKNYISDYQKLSWFIFMLLANITFVIIIAGLLDSTIFFIYLNFKRMKKYLCLVCRCTVRDVCSSKIFRQVSLYIDLIACETIKFSIKLLNNIYYIRLRQSEVSNHKCTVQPVQWKFQKRKFGVYKVLFLGHMHV